MKKKVYAAFLALVPLLTANPALALANRVFVSARSGNDANSCDDVNAPCQTLAAALTKVNVYGSVIVVESGGYGPVTITQSVTIEAAAGITAFIHAPSGDAVTVSVAAAYDDVVLRGLVINGLHNSTANGVTVNTAFRRLVIDNCQISNFGTGDGIKISAPGNVTLTNTSVRLCNVGVEIVNSVGVVNAAIDHCHLDLDNAGFYARTTSPGSSTTTATNSTANGGSVGWDCGDLTDGKDVLQLEYCTGSENTFGLIAASSNPASTVYYSNCVFSNNGAYGVDQGSGPSSTTVVTRGNNTITGNGIAPTIGTITSYAPM